MLKRSLHILLSVILVASLLTSCAKSDEALLQEKMKKYESPKFPEYGKQALKSEVGSGLNGFVSGCNSLDVSIIYSYIDPVIMKEILAFMLEAKYQDEKEATQKTLELICEKIFDIKTDKPQGFMNLLRTEINDVTLTGNGSTAKIDATVTFAKGDLPPKKAVITMIEADSEFWVVQKFLIQK